MSLPVNLDHCVVHVSDWGRSNAFYAQVVGADGSLLEFMSYQGADR
jgi:hypothetical protein